MFEYSPSPLIHLIRERMLALLARGYFREGIRSTDARDADELLTGLVRNPDGTAQWEDIDYKDASRSAWRAATHYVRIELALIRGGTCRFAEDADFREKLLAAFRFWIFRDFQNPNWWHNQIGTPAHVGDIALLMGSALTEDEYRKACALVSRGSIKAHPEIAKRTGANLIWGAFNTIRHALLTDDEELLREAAGRVAEELEFHGEGIQSDGAFLQHGARWYSGGYGASFTFDMSALVFLFHGTPLAFSGESTSHFLLHVLDGQRHMMMHGFFDPNGVGRELTRKGTLRHAELNAAIRLLASLPDLPRHDELDAFACDLDFPLADADGTNCNGADGCFFYPSVTYMSHRSRGVFIGVRCLNGGQRDEEICNGEAELCCNMSYGTRVSMMSRGDEYYDLAPLLDWSRIPGTTAVPETDEQLLAHRDWWDRLFPPESAFATTDGSLGVIAQYTEHDGISLTAAYFLFNGCLIALGTGIDDGREEGSKATRLFTTVDQCKVANPQISPDGMCVSNGAFTYLSLTPSRPLTAEVRQAVGSWQRNNRDQPDTPVAGEVFLCGFEHDASTENYAYAVTPRGEMLAARIAANTPAVQAVRLADGTLLAAFHENVCGEIDGTFVQGARKTCRIIRS